VGSTSGGGAAPSARRGRRALAAALLAGIGALDLGCRHSESPAEGGATDRRVASHAGEPPRPATAGALRVATSGDYAPFSEWPADRPEPRGFSTEVARAFARSQGASIEWVRLRWSTLADDLAAQRFDLALSGVTIRPERSLAGRFTIPLTEAGAVALVPLTSTLRSRIDLDQPSVRLAVNAGGHLERVARSLFPHARIDPQADNAAVPDALGAGRADALLTDTLEAPHWQARLAPTRAIGPLTRDRKAAWLPAGQEALARAFDRWLLSAEATGELARLRRAHGLADRRTAEPGAALLARLDERLSLMGAVAEAKRVLGRPVADAAQEARVQRAFADAAARAARERGCAAPDARTLRRFVEANLTAARLLQTRALAAPDASMPRLPDLGTKRAVEARAEAEAALDARIRPALAWISERIAWLLIEVAARDGTAAGSHRPTLFGVATALADHALPDALVAELHAALDALLSTRDGCAAPVPRASTPESAPAGARERAHQASERDRHAEADAPPHEREGRPEHRDLPGDQPVHRQQPPRRDEGDDGRRRRPGAQHAGGERHRDEGPRRRHEADGARDQQPAHARALAERIRHEGPRQQALDEPGDEERHEQDEREAQELASAAAHRLDHERRAAAHERHARERDQQREHDPEVPVEDLHSVPSEPAAQYPVQRARCRGRALIAGA